MPEQYDEHVSDYYRAALHRYEAWLKSFHGTYACYNDLGQPIYFQTDRRGG